MIIKSILCCLAIIGAALIGLVSSYIFSGGRQFGAPVVLFVPLVIAAIGYCAQSKFYVGMPVAIWAMVILEPMIIVATALIGRYRWGDLMNRSFIGDVATVSMVLGTPWMIGIIIGRKK